MNEAELNEAAGYIAKVLGATVHTTVVVALEIAQMHAWGVA